MTHSPGPNTQLPWEAEHLDDARFVSILRVFLVILLLLSLVIPWVPLPEPSRDAERELPPQLARVMLDREEQEPVPEPEPEPDEEPEPEEEAEPEEEPEPEPELEPEPEPEPPVASRVEEAREKASQSGVMRHQDELMAMREMLNPESIDNSGLSRSDSEAAQVERDMIASQTQSDSGGINTSSLSRDAAGGDLSGRETTRVESAAEARSAQGSDEAQDDAGQLSSRSDEQIRRVIDQHMGALFSIYNRALRSDPTLQGKLVVRLVIEPSGELSEVRIESSELNASDLEQRLLARILLISFPDEPVAVTRVNYTFDFLPR